MSSMDTGCYTTSLPVLSLVKPAFLSLKRQGAELRHSKHGLPNPKKRYKQHYRNLVAQNAWIRANLLDALGNYKYCSACIINTLGIGSQWLVHQKIDQAARDSYSACPYEQTDVVNDRLENFIVRPEGVDNFVHWWATDQNTDQVKVWYPHAQHGLARKLQTWKNVQSGRIFYCLWMKLVIRMVGMQAVLGPNTTFHRSSPELVKQQSQRKTVTRKQVIPFFVSSIGLKKSRIKRDALNVQLFGG